MSTELEDQDLVNENDVDESKSLHFLGLSKKQRKRELKSISFQLRELPEDATDEDKLICIFRKLQMCQVEMDSAATKAKLAEKRALMITLERDQFHDGLNKVTLQKDKLEQLCRELQKQNHQIRDQSLAMAQSEDEKRREVADRFQNGITDIQTQLNDYLEKNNSLRSENQMLAEKLQKFITEHEKREDYVQKVIKTHELETKLAEARLTQARVQHDQDLMKEKREAATAKEQCELLKQRFDAHKMVEEKLKEQIEFYKTKYQSFNKTMSKSNDLIENTKKEMEKMTKHVRNAESAALEWRSRWEQSQKSLLEVLEQCAGEKAKCSALQKQVEKLGGLCRALRAGKTEAREAEVEVPPAPPQPTPSQPPETKVDRSALACEPGGPSPRNGDTLVNSCTTTPYAGCSGSATLYAGRARQQSAPTSLPLIAASLMKQPVPPLVGVDDRDKEEEDDEFGGRLSPSK